MSRILITGGNGFLGRPAVMALTARGHELHIVSRRPDGLPAGIQHHSIDLLEPRSVSAVVDRIRATHLLHLAWLTTPGIYWTSPLNEQWRAASLHLVTEFVRHGGCRAVLAGSCAEYDWTDGLCSEWRTPLQPTSHYGRSKHVLHTQIQEYAARSGLSFAWGRLFFLYGPGEHPSRLVASVIRALLNREEALCSAGTQQRDYLLVTDAALALTALLESPVEGAVNIGSGKAVAVRDLVSRVALAIADPDRLRLEARTASQEAPLVVADVSRLRNELHWFPRFDLDTGIAESIAWWSKRFHERSAA